jgi:gag-polypeptide of LTR copia-type
MGQEHQQEADQQSDLFSERGNWCSSSLTASQCRMHNDATMELIQTKEYSNIYKIADRDHLMDENWHEWKDQMKCVFTNCDITGYVMGTVSRPNEGNNTVGVYNWDKNDCWAQQVIIHNVTSSQMNHVSSKTSAKDMYSALSVTHENKAHQTVNHIQCLLYEMKARDTNNLLKHLDVLKSYCDHINKFPNAEFHVSDT